MPSDPPPNRPTDPTSPIQGNEADTAASGATDGAAPREQPASLNADLLRFSGTGGGGPEKRSGISNSFAWSMMIAVAVIAAVLIRQGSELVEPPPRVLHPVPVAGTSAPAVASTPDPALVSAYGSGTLGLAGREARRIGQAASEAAHCGLRSWAWVSGVRDALATEMAQRYPTFDDDPKAIARMRDHIAAQYDSSRPVAARAMTERGRESVCANIRYSPDYGLAVRAAEDAGIANQ